MTSAQGRIDAVVEEFEVVVTMLDAAWDEEESKEYASVSAAIDAVAVNEADARSFHEDGHFTPVLLTLAEGDAICSCRYSVLAVLCSVADVISVDNHGAITSNFTYVTAMKM